MTQYQYQKFGLAMLGDLDGGIIRGMFDQALDRCRRDCIDRPAEGGPRKVTLLVELRPNAAPNGDLESIDATFDVQDNAPKRKSRRYNMLERQGHLLVNELAPDDARQMTIPVGPEPVDRAPETVPNNDQPQQEAADAS